MDKRNMSKFVVLILAMFVGIYTIKAASITYSKAMDCVNGACAYADKRLDDKEAFCITNNRGWPTTVGTQYITKNVSLKKRILFYLTYKRYVNKESGYQTVALLEAALDALNKKTDAEINSLCESNSDCKLSEKIISSNIESTNRLNFIKNDSNYKAEVTIKGYNLQNYDSCTIGSIGTVTKKSESTEDSMTIVNFEINIPASNITKTTNVTFSCQNAIQKYYTSNVYCHTTDGTNCVSEPLAYQDLMVPEEGERKLSISGVVNVTSKVTISKSDATGQKELPGAKLSILDKDGKVLNKCVFDNNNHLITYSESNASACTWTSSDTSYVLEGLPVGKYYLVEEIAPKGYEKSSEKIEIEITESGAVKDKVVMKNEPVKVPVPDTLSARSALAIVIAIISIASGIAIILYFSNNKVKE